MYPWRQSVNAKGGIHTTTIWRWQSSSWRRLFFSSCLKAKKLVAAFLETQQGTSREDITRAKQDGGQSKAGPQLNTDHD
jgi:hypothetical protein